MGWLSSFLAGPSDGWHWSMDAFPPLSFCVRALVLDGLAVPPFELHPDGDGRLRALGLDPVTWRAWVDAVLQQRATMSELAQALGTTEAHGAELDRARAAAEVLRAPGSLCDGPAPLRARLDALFAAYAPEGEAWRLRMSEASHLVGSGRRQRALWKALVPFHGSLETLSVFLVDYREPVVMPLPPTLCLIAPDLDPDGFARQVVQAARALAAR